MKILILLMMSFSSFASQVPSTWISEKTYINKSENHKEALDQLEGSFSKILDLQENILEKSETFSKSTINKNFSNWSLSGQKTDLAVSKSGLFGFSAVKGTSAVELSWSKKSSKSELNEDSKTDLNLSTEMSEDQVLAAAKPFYKILLKNNRKEEFSWRAKDFEDHVLRYHRALKSVSSLDQGRFVASKFRLDLSVSYSSPLFGFSRLSGDTRVRLEWKIVKSSKKVNGSSDQKVVAKLLEDIEEALENSELRKGYKLKTIGIGLGLSKKNLLSFSKVKGEIYGELFFNLNSAKGYSVAKFPIDDQVYHWSGEDKIIGSFKRRKFRKGIKKSFKVSKWFTDKMNSRASRSWEVKKFKSSFALSYSGFLGLANTSSKSAVSFAFSK
jgi:hypothetical protein